VGSPTYYIIMVVAIATTYPFSLQVLAIEFVAFAIEFVHLVIELIYLAIEFVALARKFVMIG